MKTIGGLDPFFFLFCPSAAVAVYCSLCDPPPPFPLHSVGAGMPPCSPQSCHRELFQMLLKPARACAGVKWEKMGGLLFLEDQDSRISQCQSYSMSFCLYQVSGAPFYLLSCVFNPGAPLRVRANYRIYNPCLAAALCPALRGLLCVVHQSLALTKKLVVMY